MTTEEELDDYAARLGNRLRDLVDDEELRCWKRYAEKGGTRERDRYMKTKHRYLSARRNRARNGGAE